MDTDKHRENTDTNTETIIEEIPNIKSKLNKNGQPRKQLSDADKARRAEILAEGRRKALEKRKQLTEMKKTPPVTKTIPDPEPEPVPEPVPEPDVGEDKESDDETVQVVRRVKSKPKKKTKQKIIIMNESDSSSDEEVIVKKKKKKKPTPPPTPPPIAVEQPRPSIPQMSEEDMERIRRDKIRRYTEKKKQEKLMASIFG